MVLQLLLQYQKNTFVIVHGPLIYIYEQLITGILSAD